MKECPDSLKAPEVKDVIQEENKKIISDLLEALELAYSILDRMSDEYSEMAHKHANFTRGEDLKIRTAISNTKNYIKPDWCE